MFFKNHLFLLITFFFLTSCGLELGEESENPFIYKITSDENFCDILDYKSELQGYMSNVDYTASNYRVKYVLGCLSFNIDRYGSGIVGNDQRFFTIAEIVKLLNEPVVNTESTTPVIDKILDIYYLHNILSAKNSLIDVMEKHQNKRSIEFQGYCPKSDKQVILREELKTFTSFLGDFSDFLISVNISSEKFFYLLYNTRLNQSTPLKGSSVIFEKSLLPASFQKIIKNNLWDTPSNFFKHVSPEKKEAVVSSLTSMLLDYNNPKDRYFLTRGHIKYMLFNVYLVETLFDLYDQDSNLILDKDELSNAFCLFNSLITILTTISSEDGLFPGFMRFVFSEKLVFYYVLKYKELPKEFNFDVFKMRFLEIIGDDSLSDVSVDYADLTEVFQKIFGLVVEGFYTEEPN